MDDRKAYRIGRRRPRCILRSEQREHADDQGTLSQIAHRGAGRRIILEIGDGLALRLQLLRCIEGNVSLSAVQQHFHIFFIYIATLRLTVRAVFPTEADALIKADSQPFERFDNVFFRTRNETV